MEKEIDLRDKIAMEMSTDMIPVLKDLKAVKFIARKLNINVDVYDDASMMNFSLNYQAAIRYMYADAMLAARERSGRTL